MLQDGHDQFKMILDLNITVPAAATYEHVQRGLCNRVRCGDLPQVRADAPERAGYVDCRLPAALRDERVEGLRDECGADDVRLEARRQVLCRARERGIEAAGVLASGPHGAPSGRHT